MSYSKEAYTGPMLGEAKLSDRPTSWAERVAQDAEVMGNRLSNSLMRLDAAISRTQGSPSPQPPQAGIPNAPTGGCTMSRMADAQQRIDSLLSQLEQSSEQIETLI